MPGSNAIWRGPLVLLGLSLLMVQPSQSQVIFSCNFDRPSFCNMVQSTADQFDWTLRMGRTPSGSLHVNDNQNTGPSGGQGGSPYYIYIEATDRARGDIARLTTPPLNVTGDICLDFYYHMLGADVGSLAVYVQRGRGNQDFTTPVWENRVNMGDVWLRVRVSAFLQQPSDRIEFRGTRGGQAGTGFGWSSDLAFDSIQVQRGRCEGSAPVPTPAPPTNEGPDPTPDVTPLPTSTTTMGDPGQDSEVTLPFVCDFESSLCGMRGFPSPGILEWTRIRDGTPTFGTGPSAAYSGLWYIYAETSDPSQPGDRFLIQTLPIRYQGTVCLSFAFHMNGEHVGRFLIYTSRVAFERNGSQGDQWNTMSVDINIAYPDVIVFEVTRGTGIRGDVGLDNVRIDPGTCSSTVTPPPPVTPFPTPAPPPSNGIRQLPWQCGFETDFCGMQQPITDRFDWMRQALATPTVGTGPMSARVGTYYVYAEASDPRIRGDVALLLTPMFDYSGEVCVEFYYHMYGTGSGTLTVFVTRFLYQSFIFRISGNQGNQWRFQRVTAPRFNFGDQITFNATRGPSYTSDIALDAVAVYPGSCQGGVTPGPPTAPPPPTPAPPVTGDTFSCDGERVQVSSITNCRLRQDNREDQLDWTQGSGRTPSGALFSRRGPNNALFPVTGPSGARQGQNYLYIEASGKPRDLVARIFIEGDTVRPSGRACLRFYYSMNGFHMGEVRVFTRQGGAPRQVRWRMYGDQGEGWQRAAVDLNMNGISEAGIEATTRGEFSGDASIDDIQMQQGACTSTPSQYVFLCSFETGDGAATWCGMEQDRNDRFDWSLGKRATLSQLTGPDRAFSGEYYMYIEASRPRVAGDFAILLTPPINWNGDLCAEFMYHMFGFHIGTLELFIRDGFNADTAQLTLTGQKGNQWLQGRVTLSNFRAGAQVGFRGVRGQEYSGDIAVDSVTLRPGRC